MNMGKVSVRAVASFSGKGKRPGQEDQVLALQDRGIFVVADGFGGPTPGAQASKMACEEVRHFLVKEAGDLEATMPFVLRSYFSLAGNVLFNALVHANRKLIRLNQGKSMNERGGASVLAAFMDGDLLALANVGGCTAWLFRGGQATELVMPRTYGRLCDPFSSEAREDQRVPLMAVGMAEDLEPEIFEYRLQRGDWLLLQTDGLAPGVRECLLLAQQKGLSPEAAAQEASQIFSQGVYDDNTAASLMIF